MESRDIVRETLEEEGKLLVTFMSHAGYYNVPLAEKSLCGLIREAEGSRKEVSFTFDRDLKILSVR